MARDVMMKLSPFIPPSDGKPWMACEHPERPPDNGTLWHVDDCRACAVRLPVDEAHIDAAIRRGMAKLFR